MELLFKDLSYQITGAAFDVHKDLGCGFLEKVYQEAFAIALQERDVNFEREKKIQISYHQRPLSTPYICDFCVENKIIVELKSVQKIEEVHKAQLINYLKATGRKLGILINFNAIIIHPIRLINPTNILNTKTIRK